MWDHPHTAKGKPKRGAPTKKARRRAEQRKRDHLERQARAQRDRYLGSIRKGDPEPGTLARPVRQGLGSEGDPEPGTLARPVRQGLGSDFSRGRAR